MLNNLSLNGWGWEGVWQKICDKNLVLDNFELVSKSSAKISANVKADLRQQEIKELVGIYIKGEGGFT